MRMAMLAAACLAASIGAAQAQDVASGKALFKKCAFCHGIGEGAQNKVGPQLNGLNGRKAGAVPDFDYSDALKNSGIVWNETTFKQYISDPQAMIPRSKKVFAGIKDERERNDLWAYLSQFAAAGGIKK